MSRGGCFRSDFVHPKFEHIRPLHCLEIEVQASVENPRERDFEKNTNEVLSVMKLFRVTTPLRYSRVVHFAICFTFPNNLLQQYDGGW